MRVELRDLCAADRRDREKEITRVTVGSSVQTFVSMAPVDRSIAIIVG
jgi:hypothetical protein